MSEEKTTVTVVASIIGSANDTQELGSLIRDVLDVYADAGCKIDHREYRANESLPWLTNILTGICEKLDKQLRVPYICKNPDCKVVFWQNAVDTGGWQDRATTYDDAISTLASYQLLCDVFHNPRSVRMERNFLKAADEFLRVCRRWEEYESRGMGLDDALR